MGKKDKSKKGKGAEPELSKKDRKKLERRAAELEAELAEREAAEKKAAKKAGKKGKGKEPKPSVAEAIADAVIPNEVDIAAADKTMLGKVAKPEKVIAAADKVLADKGAPEVVKEKARKVKAKAQAESAPEADAEVDPDEAIKERVQRKAAARARLEALDRNDEDAVRAFNETDGKLLGHYATHTGEVEETIAKMDRHEQRLRAAAGEGDEPARQDVEEVVTEEGRVFEAGESKSDPEVAASEKAKSVIDERGFALPSEARGDFPVNGNKQYMVQRPSDGRVVGYTRVTTFIDAIDDKTTLNAWKMRTLLEGIVVNETQVGEGADDDLLMSRVRDLVHRRDVALAKARKAQRKGKLAVGELGRLEAGARKDFKDAMVKIVDQLLELGGVHEKANKGTNIHDLCQLYDQSGMDAVAQLLTDGKISDADFADVEAYARALEAAGIKHVDSEVMVVNDELRRAGRLDSIKYVRFPGQSRATKVVADIKTGSVEFGTKIPMQLENYASMQGYDPANPSERVDLKLSRTKALLIHLPQGQAECHLYPVDLATGRVGNKIAKDVRDFRSAGKRGIDFKTDLATGIALEAPEEA